jgi:hypothetical protein
MLENRASFPGPSVALLIEAPHRYELDCVSGSEPLLDKPCRNVHAFRKAGIHALLVERTHLLDKSQFGRAPSYAEYLECNPKAFHLWQAGPLPASGGLYAQAALTTPTTSLGYRADGLLLSRLHMIAVEVAYRGTSRGTQFKSAIERPLSSARNKLPGVETNSSQTLKRRVSLLDSVWLERLRVGDNTVRLLSQAEEVVHLEHW